MIFVISKTAFGVRGIGTFSFRLRLIQYDVLTLFKKKDSGCYDETLSSGALFDRGVYIGAGHAAAVASISANIYCQLILLNV